MVQTSQKSKKKQVVADDSKTIKKKNTRSGRASSSE